MKTIVLNNLLHQYSTLFGIVLALVISACDSNLKKTFSELNSIDELIENNPDSAQKLLNSMSVENLPRSLRAHRDLLITKSRVKSGVSIMGDTAIIRAFDFYKSHQGSKAIQASYYYAEKLLEENKLDSALTMFNQAYTLSCNKSDWYYAGLSAYSLSKIFLQLNTYDPCIDYAYKSEKIFCLADSTSLSLSVIPILLEALVNKQDFETADSLLNTIDYDQIDHNYNLKSALTNSIIRYHFERNNYIKVDSLYKQISNNGDNIHPTDLYMWATANIELNKWDEAKKITESIHNNPVGIEDSIKSQLIRAQFLKHEGSVEMAYNELNDAFSKYHRYVRKNSSSDKLVYLLNDIKNKNKTYRKDIHTIKTEYKTIFIYFSIGIISILIIIPMAFVIIRQSQRIITLKTDKINTLNFLISDLIESKNTLERELKNNDSNPQEDSSDVFKAYIKILDNIIAITDQAESLKDKRNNYVYYSVKNMVDDFQTSESAKLVVSYIGNYRNKLLNQYDKIPSLNSKEKELIPYLIAGFSNYALQIIFKFDTGRAVENAKTRLRKKIRDSGLKPEF